MISCMDVTLHAADDRPVTACVAKPAQPNGAAVVLLHEIFGVNHYIRTIATRYADLGYWVVAPATFGRVRPDVSLGYSAHDIRLAMACKRAAQALPPPGVLPDVQAAIDIAGQQGPVGIIGFSWGALLGWRAACLLEGVEAAALYYGGGMTHADEIARTPRVPVLAHFARHDPSISVVSVHRFEAAHPDVASFLYEARHGFHCDERDSWDAAAAACAQARTDAFLARHLLPAPTAPIHD